MGLQPISMSKRFQTPNSKQSPISAYRPASPCQPLPYPTRMLEDLVQALCGQEEDHLARVEEAITRMLVCALKTAEDPHHPRAWLNPTEVEDTSHEVNCCYLNDAVCAFFDRCGKAKVETQALRADWENWRKEEPSVREHMDVGQAHSPSFTARTWKRELASQFG